MGERLHVVGLRGSACPQIDRDILCCRLETVEGIPELYPGPSGDDHLIRTEVATLRLTPCLVGPLPMGFPAVALRSPWTAGDGERFPAPGAVVNSFCHSGVTLPPASRGAVDQISRRSIKATLATIAAPERTMVEPIDRQ
jgi:hypothetical protein